MPTELLSALRTTPVLELVNETLAPGMTALLTSCTVPRTMPSPVCAASGRATTTSENSSFLACDKKVPSTMNFPPLCGQINMPQVIRDSLYRHKNRYCHQK